MPSRDESDARLIVQCGKCGAVNKQTYRNTEDVLWWICEQCNTMNWAETGENAKVLIERAKEKGVYRVQ